jgi:hypothetical protein
MPMETMSEALQRLAGAGYGDEYRADPEGLRARSDGRVYPAKSFHVEEIVRFEGESDPSEEAAIFALTRTVDGSKGTYTVAFGTLMDPVDGVLVERLSGHAGLRTN